ncbi:MAG: serine hydrolase [Parcubacteria group bacterium]
MLNIILTLILLPFIPVWSYGNIPIEVDDIFANSSKTICLVSADSNCNGGSQVLGEQKQNESAADLNKIEGGGFNGYNLFPIDKALASGFVPVKNTSAPDIQLWADSSVAVDAESGTLLHYNNGRRHMQIASLTKMMTAVLVMEKIKDLDEEVLITKDSLNRAGTIVGCPTSTFCNGEIMVAGEKIHAIDLLKAMLMNSANDAAASLAAHIAGTEKEFVKMMNEKAQDLGLKDTHFCTASGLEIDGQEDQCYSSAYDIARIAAYSLQYKKIWEIMEIPEGKFYSTDGKYEHDLKNTDLLLDNVPNCIGGKTGFTPLAGKSLLLGALDPTRKHKVIAVVLNDEYRWDDMKALVSWVFSNYKWQ